MDKLLMYDYIYTKKGRGSSNLLISGIGKARTKKRKRQEDDLLSDGRL